MIFRILAIAVPFIWFGLLGGISFLEAPLKFQAPGITLGLGLGIGRLVFGLMNKLEIGLAVMLIVSFVLTKPKGKFATIAIAIVVLLLFLDTVWLLPVLDVRAQAIMYGTGTPFSNTHIVYIAFDAVKFVLLFAIGVNLTKQNLRLAV